jgi:hypothetical protein
MSSHSPGAAGSPSSNGSETLAQLFMRVEYAKVGSGAGRTIARERSPSGWQDMPAWRFFRNVVRVGLYLRERCSVAAADRVVFVSPARSERLAAEWATVLQGAVVAPISANAPDEVVAASLARIAPKLAFVARPADGERLLRLHRDLHADRVVTFDAPADAATALPTWSAILDLGGTLDTAERAQAFRASARALRSEMPAIVGPVSDRDVALSTATHAELVRRIVGFWGRLPPADNDLAYVADDGTAAGLRLALWAFVADGRTTIAFGTPSCEVEEIAEMRPSVIALPRETLERVRASIAERATKTAPSTSHLGRLAQLAKLATLARIAQRVRPRTPKTESTKEVLPQRFVTLEGEPAD